MANYHLSGKIFSRAKGHSAVAAASYRAGEKLHDDRLDLDYDYTRKQKILDTEILAPDHAPGWIYDREQLWNRAESCERRKDAQIAREIEVSLPRELDFEAQQNLVRDFVRQEFVDQGMVADISYHSSSASDGGENPHAHILLTMRAIEGEGFSQKKNRDWNKKENLVGWREAWANCTNDYLAGSGSEEMIDHRSYADQGRDIEPTIHMGKDATNLERQGIETDRGNINREIEHRNRLVIHIQAAASWMKQKTIDVYQQIKHRIQERVEPEIQEPDKEQEAGLSR